MPLEASCGVAGSKGNLNICRPTMQTIVEEMSAIQIYFPGADEPIFDSHKDIDQALNNLLNRFIGVSSISAF